MKTLWQKTPPWIKAILFNFILLYPVIIIIQLVIGTNQEIGSQWAWAFPATIVLLIIFWKLCNHLADFSKPNDVSLRLGFQVKNGANWSYLAAIVLLIPSIIMLWAYLFKIDNTAQLALIASFRSLTPQTALPLLLGLALSAGIVEEVVYRGFIQNTLTRAYPKWVSFLLVAIIFAVMHLLPLPLLVPYMMVSLIFSFVADKTRSTGVVIIAHVLVDFLLFALVYFEPVNLLQASLVNILVFSGMLVLGVTFLLLPLKRSIVSLSNVRLSSK